MQIHLNDSNRVCFYNIMHIGEPQSRTPAWNQYHFGQAESTLRQVSSTSVTINVVPYFMLSRPNVILQITLSLILADIINSKYMKNVKVMS